MPPFPWYQRNPNSNNPKSTLGPRIVAEIQQLLRQSKQEEPWSGMEPALAKEAPHLIRHVAPGTDDLKFVGNHGPALAQHIQWLAVTGTPFERCGVCRQGSTVCRLVKHLISGYSPLSEIALGSDIPPLLTNEAEPCWGGLRQNASGSYYLSFSLVIIISECQKLSEFVRECITDEMFAELVFVWQGRPVAPIPVSMLTDPLGKCPEGNASVFKALRLGADFF
ncbi:hypothetical protein BKA70DRAFT_1236562 [Coprinopsis sp. MPI-PUGE-AT-0042]|nr:hypothetical protein BKA70DRAFT_1236562 [Coprinopsis sp. MPI-PUGE-AT-0042]